MRRGVYIETSIVSYLASRPSRDLVVAGRQQLTHAWWDRRRASFDLYVSQVVLDEVRVGDPEAAQRRHALVGNLPLLDVTTNSRKSQAPADSGAVKTKTHSSRLRYAMRNPADAASRSNSPGVKTCSYRKTSALQRGGTIVSPVSSCQR